MVITLVDPKRAFCQHFDHLINRRADDLRVCVEYSNALYLVVHRRTHAVLLQDGAESTVDFLRLLPTPAKRHDVRVILFHRGELLGDERTTRQAAAEEHGATFLPLLYDEAADGAALAQALKPQPRTITTSG